MIYIITNIWSYSCVDPLWAWGWKNHKPSKVLPLCNHRQKQICLQTLFFPLPESVLKFSFCDLRNEVMRRIREKASNDMLRAPCCWLGRTHCCKWGGVLRQCFVSGITHGGTSRMAMFTCLTKRIASQLPRPLGTEIHNVKVQFYPIIKLNLLSGNSFSFFPLFLLQLLSWCSVLHGCRSLYVTYVNVCSISVAVVIT